MGKIDKYYVKNLKNLSHNLSKHTKLLKKLRKTKKLSKREKNKLKYETDNFINSVKETSNFPAFEDMTNVEAELEYRIVPVSVLTGVIPQVTPQISTQVTPQVTPQVTLPNVKSLEIEEDLHVCTPHAKPKITSVNASGSQIIYPAKPLTALDIRACYSVDSIKLTNTTDLKIGIVVAYRYSKIQEDFDVFCDKNGFVRYQLNIINLGSTFVDNPEWACEACLDVQAVYSITANVNPSIYIACSKSPSMQDMVDAIQYCKDNKFNIINMSFGTYEFNGCQKFDALFNSDNIFVASTGDSNYASTPSTSKNVISVGGSTNYLNSEKKLVKCTTWDKGGTGTSKYNVKPAYQSGIAGAKRVVPDFSMNANPKTGLVIQCSLYGGYCVVGGTSLSAPLTAGFLYLVNIQRTILKKPLLTSNSTSKYDVHTTLYKSIYANKSNYSQCFFDIVEGFDTTKAKVGYDCVGLGSPLLPPLYDYLTNI